VKLYLLRHILGVEPFDVLITLWRNKFDDDDDDTVANSRDAKQNEERGLSVESQARLGNTNLSSYRYRSSRLIANANKMNLTADTEVRKCERHWGYTKSSILGMEEYLYPPPACLISLLYLTHYQPIKKQGMFVT
jgi:hypothetical protein